MTVCNSTQAIIMTTPYPPIATQSDHALPCPNGKGTVGLIGIVIEQPQGMKTLHNITTLLHGLGEQWPHEWVHTSYFSRDVSVSSNARCSS